MKYLIISAVLLSSIFIYSPIHAQTAAADAETKSRDSAVQVRADGMVKSLNLNDSEKEQRVAAVIFTHLKAVRDWNNRHQSSMVPDGIDPATGKPLSDMDKQIIVNSSIPKSVHQDLMAGLRNNLTEDQVSTILDKYTVGKVAFTMQGYKAIVPDLTDEEAVTIEGYLKQAREQAVDFKNMKQISAIFEIYKTKSEQYLNSHGRNWHQLYGDYTKKIQAEKKAKADQK